LRRSGRRGGPEAPGGGTAPEGGSSLTAPDRAPADARPAGAEPREAVADAECPGPDPHPEAPGPDPPPVIPARPAAGADAADPSTRATEARGWPPRSLADHPPQGGHRFPDPPPEGPPAPRATLDTEREDGRGQGADPGRPTGRVTGWGVVLEEVRPGRREERAARATRPEAGIRISGTEAPRTDAVLRIIGKGAVRARDVLVRDLYGEGAIGERRRRRPPGGDQRRRDLPREVRGPVDGIDRLDPGGNRGCGGGRRKSEPDHQGQQEGAHSRDHT
jgi:hypothetical protein